MRFQRVPLGVRDEVFAEAPKRTSLIPDQGLTSRTLMRELRGAVHITTGSRVNKNRGYLHGPLKPPDFGKYHGPVRARNRATNTGKPV